MGNAGGLDLIKQLVSKKRYRYSNEIETCLERCDYDPDDIEVCVQTGYVHKTMTDKLGDSKGDKIYVIIGRERSGYEFYTKGKIKKWTQGEEYFFFISAHYSIKGRNK